MSKQMDNKNIAEPTYLLGEYKDFFEDQDILNRCIDLCILPGISIHVTNNIDNRATHGIEFYANNRFQDIRLFGSGEVVVFDKGAIPWMPLFEFVGTYENAGNVKGIGPYRGGNMQRYVEGILNALKKCHDDHYANYKK